MGLNCKAGDLAVVVRSQNGKKIGRLVQVIRFFGVARFKSGAIHPDCWLVTTAGSPLETYTGVYQCARSEELGADGCFPDAYLRPIRPGAGEDECLRYAGKPAPVVRKLTAPEFDAAVNSWEKA